MWEQSRVQNSKSSSDYSSAYGASGSSSGSGECCPAVIDPLLLTTLIAFIAAATYLLNQEIAMSNLAKKRKKRYLNYIVEGNITVYQSAVFLSHFIFQKLPEKSLIKIHSAS